VPAGRPGAGQSGHRAVRLHAHGRLGGKCENETQMIEKIGKKDSFHNL
jgi:hypothetical protein